MSIANKKAFDLISECAEADAFNTNSIFDADVKCQLDGLYADIKKEIDDNAVVYSKDSIPVLQIDDDDDHPFCVELDMLEKYISTNSLVDIDSAVEDIPAAVADQIAKAVEDIAEANNISASDLYVLIESEEEATEYLEESKKLKKAGSKKKLTGLFNTATVLKMLKTKGIKVAKKRSSKKAARKKIKESYVSEGAAFKKADEVFAKYNLDNAYRELSNGVERNDVKLLEKCKKTFEDAREALQDVPEDSFGDKIRQIVTSFFSYDIAIKSRSGAGAYANVRGICNRFKLMKENYKYCTKNYFIATITDTISLCDTYIKKIK